MNEIRPGILVEIRTEKMLAPFPRDALGFKKFNRHVGAVGKVHEPHPDFPELGKRWEVDGAELGDGIGTVWPEAVLFPINDGTVDRLIEKWQHESRQGVPA